MNNVWMILIGFFIGLLCHLTVNVPSGNEQYLKGYKEGLEDARKQLLKLLKQMQEDTNEQE